MDLTREFLEKVEEMVQPQTLTEGIRTFVDKPMHMLVDEIAADTPLHTNSLSSVADYIKSNADFDALASDGRKIIHVEDEKTVWLYTEMNSFKKRSALLLASAWVLQPGCGGSHRRPEYQQAGASPAGHCAGAGAVRPSHPARR